LNLISWKLLRKHLIPKQLIAHGLENKHVEFGESAIKKIISEYTREAGVRNLEREIASIFRKLAKEIVVKESNNGKGKKEI
jgi:ATP-dependent Lon protease